MSISVRTQGWDAVFVQAWAENACMCIFRITQLQRHTHREALTKWINKWLNEKALYYFISTALCSCSFVIVFSSFVCLCGQCRTSEWNVSPSNQGSFCIGTAVHVKRSKVVKRSGQDMRAAHTVRILTKLCVCVCVSLCVCRQPWYYGWGFNLPRGQALLDKWNQVPDNTDILVTHCPPLGETQITAHVHTRTHTFTCSLISLAVYYHLFFYFPPVVNSGDCPSLV